MEWDVQGRNPDSARRDDGGHETVVSEAISVREFNWMGGSLSTMNGDRLRAGVVVILGVLAISAAAATFDEPPTETQVGAGSGDGDGFGSGDGDGPGTSDTQASEGVQQQGEDTIPTELVENVLQGIFAVGIAAVVGYVAFLIRRDGLDALKRILRSIGVLIGTAALSLLGVAGLAFLVWLFLSENEPVPQEVMDPTVSEREPSGAGDATVTDPTTTVIVVLGLVLVAVLLALVFHTTSASRFWSTGAASEERADGFEDRTSNGAVLPGTSLDDAEASNAVYEAWREMATSVDQSGLSTATPAEIARQADEDGFDRAAVRSLTATFEEVRYGERSVTPDREARAQSALDELDENSGDSS